MKHQAQATARRLKELRPTRMAGSDHPVPKLPESQERIIRAVAVVALLYGTYWIGWRWTSTINTDPVAFVPSLLLLVAETWALINMAFFVFMVWRFPDRDPGPPPAGRTVDIFITAYDEPLEVLRRTAIGAKAVRYPHKTYILDDGKREDLRALCEELGIGYIRRVGNANAKAGNLNHALSVTNGEFVMQMDADHVPLPHILDRMLGYFRDPKVAVVQSPQDFYNTDSFTHVRDDRGRRLWEENRIFFSLIQAGRDNWNASFFCGSCGILRRSALESIGGFSTETIIEDQETTIKLHGRGWKSIYHPETLAYGLAPTAAGAYHVQRLRWGQGSMQLLRKINPLTYPGLSIPQRLCYFAGLSTYLEGFQKTIFYLMPLLYFYTGILPIDVNQTEFLLKLLPYLVVVIVAFELLARGTGYVLISERYTMVRFFTYVVAVSGYFAKGKLKFNVTPKGKAGVPFRTYAPQLVLMLLSIGAPIWATFAFAHGWVDYGEEAGWGSISFALTAMWTLWNLWFAAYVVHHSLVMRQQRDDHRFVEHLPVHFRAGGRRSGFRLAVTHDLNPAGLAFRTAERLQPGTRLRLRLTLSTGPVEVAGRVVHVAETRHRYGGVHLHGVAFEKVPLKIKDRIEVHCTQHSAPIWRARYRQSIDILQRVREVVANARGERRHLVQLPARVVAPGDDGDIDLGTGILEEVSPGGARLFLDGPIEPGTLIDYQVPGTALSGRGVVRFSRMIESPMSARYAVGLQHEMEAAETSGGWVTRVLAASLTRIPVRRERTAA